MTTLNATDNPWHDPITTHLEGIAPHTGPEGGPVTRRGVYVNTDDLVDSVEVAEIAGWESFRAVSQYRTRHPDTFPAPVVDKRRQCKLWRRSDIEAWKRNRGR